ncbi:MAG: hypothetical protein VW378_02595 [bacterium]
MTQRILIYDQNPHLAMILTLFVDHYCFSVVKSTQALEEESQHSFSLLILVQEAISRSLFSFFNSYKQRYPKVKFLLLSNQLDLLRQWKNISDLVLCDWTLGDPRIIQAIDTLCPIRTS